VLAKADISSDEIAAIGITNQRETAIVWERETGKPIYNAIVWQCRRTAEICEQLKRDGMEEYIRKATGLVVDPYFSGTKEMDPRPRRRRPRARKRGELLFGTVDTWLIWKMTQGRVHVTDYTNASRTMLFNIHELDWDDKMLDALDIRAPCCRKCASLPKCTARPTSAVKAGRVFLSPVSPVTSRRRCSASCASKKDGEKHLRHRLLYADEYRRESGDLTHGLLTTIACGPRGEVNYALEGAVFMAAPPFSGCAMR
jgi:glycerol kinase